MARIALWRKKSQYFQEHQPYWPPLEGKRARSRKNGTWRFCPRRSSPALLAHPQIVALALVIRHRLAQDVVFRQGVEGILDFFRGRVVVGDRDRAGGDEMRADRLGDFARYVGGGGVRPRTQPPAAAACDERRQGERQYSLKPHQFPASPLARTMPSGPAAIKRE